MSRRTFVQDMEKIREQARLHIQNGALTEGYKADRETVIKLLNCALATEIICVLRYKRHYFMAQGIDSETAAREFLEHAEEEQQHADMIAKRITQLQGEPDFSPHGLLSRGHSEYVEGDNLNDMIMEDLIAERTAIDSYREIIRYIGDDDPTTRRMLEEILATEEEHADDMAGLISSFSSRAPNALQPAKVA